jgi:hypothetical protein
MFPTVPETLDRSISLSYQSSTFCARYYVVHDCAS